MDRRAAGALLALAACIACSAAAPTASNQTALDLYESAPEGCYYNFQHYGEGDRIMTNEPCLNCTCHNRMLMCYLRVCPFTKAIGQDCTVEKRADQCCPIVTCPDVPVDLLTSTSTTSPAEYGATGLGKLDKYGCSINGKYFPEGSKVPPTPNKPCEHCYCIRNMTTCVMQECTLHVDGCTPIYHKDVCCPVRYSCDHPEDEVPLLDDMSTTVRPTPGFLLTTTTMSPVTQMTQDCVHDDQVFADGALIKTEKACEHCYCMKGDIVCVVQECGAPMENEGKNCTSLPPREGQCCPDTYICEGDELTSELSTESTTDVDIEKLTTLLPPRRTSVEGSGYRNEPDEAPYTQMPIIDSEVEGSGEEQETSKPLGPNEIIPGSEDGDQYIYVTTKAPAFEEHEQTTTEINDIKDKTVKPHVYIPTTNAPGSEEKVELTTSGMIDEDIIEPHKHDPATKVTESYESATTELGESVNTVPDEIPDQEIAKPHEHISSTTMTPTSVESESFSTIEGDHGKKEADVTVSAHSETSEPESSTPISSISDSIEKETATPTDISNVTPEVITDKEYYDGDNIRTTTATSIENNESLTEEEKESSEPEKMAPSTTSSPSEEKIKLTTEPDHAQNTVAVAEEENTHPYSHIATTTIVSPKLEEESTTELNLEKDFVTNKDFNKDVLSPHDHVTTVAPVMEETEPDRGLNTIPNEIDEETSSEPSVPDKTTISSATKETEPSFITDEIQTQGYETKSTTAYEVTTLLPDKIITKGDQFTITTEPSFRKDDESIVSTEKPKEIEPTTVRSEFVDEGLIPTSPHEEKVATSSDTPTIDEEFTTSVPEYITEVTETIGSKQTTTESPKDSVVTEKVSEPSSEPDSDLSSSTEKVSETYEEPSRIPGEGDCLLNGVTYRNNSVVPSTNNCHTGCRCASSIIKCDPIICSPPPDYMDNCQSIYDSPDSCCPTYVCDHPRETVPPQSDNQMSGTESPTPSPTFECRGDQCEIIEPTKQPTGPSELCTSDTCLTGIDHKPETECGSEGCGDVLQKPEQTDKCDGGKCKPEDCSNGKCELPQIQDQVSPVKPCEGEHCEQTDEVISESPQLCKNEEECKTMETHSEQATPCEGESCNKIDCGDGGCDPDVIVSPPTNQLESCKDKDSCTPQDIPVPDCTGDEPCRRKEISTSDEKLPTACEGSNCINEMETTVAQGIVDLSTESPPTEQGPTKEVTEIAVAEEDKTTELPGSHISKPDAEKMPVEDTQKIHVYTTESQTDAEITDADTQKEKPEDESEVSKKPVTAFEEKGTETPALIDKGDKEIPAVEGEITETPTVIEKEGTESAMIDEKGEKKPAIEGEGTELPSMLSEQDTEKPSIIDEDAKEKPVEIEEESTKKPITDEEEGTMKPVIIKDGETTIPDIPEAESSEKPTTTEDKGTEVSVIIDQESTDIPVNVAEADTEKPHLIDEEGKDKPLVFEKDSTEKSAIGEDGTEKPFIVDEEGKDKPTDVDMKDMDKPATIDQKDKEEPVKEIGTDKPALMEQESTDKLVDEKEATEKPDFMKEKSTTVPVLTNEEEKEKPAGAEEEFTKKPTDVIEKVTEVPTFDNEDDEKKPTVIDEEGTEKPEPEEKEKKPTEFEEEDTKKPTTIDKDGTEKPLVKEDDKKESGAVEQESTEKSATVDKEEPEKAPETEEAPKEKPAVSEESTEKLALVDEEKSSESPTITIDESSDIPAIGDTDTEKPASFNEQKPADDQMEITKEPADLEIEGTELPVIVGDDHTEKPVISDEEAKEKPAILDEDNTKKPGIVEEEDTIKPFITEEEITATPDLTEEQGTAKPVIIDEGTEEPTSIIKEVTTKPDFIEKESTELPAIIGEEDSEKKDEESKEKPDLTNQESTMKPATFEERTDKPVVTEEEGKITPTMIEESSDKPGITGESGTDEPVIFEKDNTEMPELTEELSTEKPVLIDDEDKIKHDDDEDTKKPILLEEKGQEKPVINKEEEQDKPPKIDAETTDEPIYEFAGTKEPHAHEEGSGTEVPIVSLTNEPEISVQPVEETMTENEKSTETPTYESQTTLEDVKHKYTTESIAVELEVSTPQHGIMTSEIPEIKVTESEDDESTVPDILEHSRIPAITTESLMEQEITTKIFVPEQEPVTVSEQQVEVTTAKLDATDIEEVSSTVGQYFPSDKATLSTGAPALHETSESAETTTEIGSVSEHEKIFTDKSETESTSTKAPGAGPVITEPHEGIEPETPELPVTGKTEEEGTTKVYDEDKVKPIPESHVTEASSASPEYGSSDLVTQVPEINDEDKTKHELLESDKKTTQLPDDEIKTHHPEIYSTDKYETITETPAYHVTEPERRFTEIEDPSVTGHENIATGYTEESSEPHIPTATEKIDESVSMEKTTTEKQLLTEMVTKAPDAEQEKPTSEFELPATEKPTSVVSETEDISHVTVKDVTSYEEKTTTTMSDLSDQKHKYTTLPEGYTEPHEPITDIPQYHVTEKEEHSKTTESDVTEPSITVQHVTKPQDTTTVEQKVTDAQAITTDIPISEKEEEAATKAPELVYTESHDVDNKEPSVEVGQKLSTELPTTLEDVRIEMPGVQATSEVPQSLVTEQKVNLDEQITVSSIPKEESSQKPELLTTQFEEISKATDPHEAQVQEGQTTQVSVETVTEKQQTTMMMHESPAVIKEIELTTSTEHTPETEFSETTPYLIELQEHTHKIVEDVTTVSPSEEHSYKPVEDISTPSPSEDEHSYKPVEDISTSSPSEEEHSHKPVEDITTSSPSEEEHSHKPVEDISTSSPFLEEHSHKPVEDISIASPSEEEHSYKPVEDILTSSPFEDELSHKPVDEISTSSPSEEEHSQKPVEDISTSYPSEEEHSYKPVEDISTSYPLEEEHSYKPVEDISTSSPSKEEHSYKPVEDISTASPPKEEHSYKPTEDISTSSPLTEEYTSKSYDLTTASPYTEKYTTVHTEAGQEPQFSDLTTKMADDEMETVTKEAEASTKPSGESPEDVSEKISGSVAVEETTPAVVLGEDNKYDGDHKEYTTSTPTQITEQTTPAVVTESEKLPISESDIAVPTEKEITTSEKPLHPIVSHETTAPEEEFIFPTTKPTTERQGEDIATPVPEDKFEKPDEKPIETSEVPPSSTPTAEVSKPSSDLQPTDEIPIHEDDGHFPPSGTSGYGEPDYVEEDQAFGPGTCRYGGKVYVSAQQIPRDDPCDFCFCFRSDIICLQQSCPPPIHGCHEEPIQGFCCPRYECPVSMATTVNVTTTTTTTTTTLPPHFPTHSYKGAAHRRGCQIKGHTYKVGEFVRSSSGPCLHCTCGGDGQMKCDPKACTPEPMLRQMIAAAVSAKRRR